MESSLVAKVCIWKKLQQERSKNLSTEKIQDRNSREDKGAAIRQLEANERN